jgi:transcriptional regulator GlxA family with amidase domain
VFLLLPEIEVLDLAGPLQVFHEANRIDQRYRVRYCSTAARVKMDGGLVLAELESLPEIGADDVVVVPGMPYRFTTRIDRGVARWLKKSAAAGASIASVCTGAFILGDAGLLDGRRCTTHWGRIAELRQRFPKAHVLEDRLFVSDGPITTSAGIASGIDMALAMIERLQGPLVAATVAREMVVYLRRDGSHQQKSIYLEFRTHLHPGIHRVQDWLIRTPEKNATIPELASVAKMSRRNLTRAFRTATGITIQDFTTRLRLELAKSLVHDPSLTIETIAERCGLGSARQLRRIWRKAFGDTPRRMGSDPKRHQSVNLGI